MLVANLTVGATVGLVAVIFSISMAAMVFTGPLAAFLANGIGMALLTSLSLMLLATLLGSLPGTAATVQDAPAAVLAAVGLSLVAALPAGSLPVEGFITVVALIALTTLATGAVFLAFGVLRLGRLVRFVPYPVVGGFMAGTGWLILTGGVAVMAGVRPSLGYVADLLAPGVWWRWLPGVAYALVIILVTRLTRSYLAWPALVFGGVAAFYAVLLASGASVGGWRANGLLLGPFPDANLLRPVRLADLEYVRWAALVRHLPTVGSVVLLSLLALLLNATGIEVASRRRVDLDRELRAAGLANLLAGSVGGMVGYHVLSLTALNLRAGSGSRVASLTSVLVIVFSLVIGVSVFAFIPTAIVGGLLVYLGGSFLIEWLGGAFTKLTRVEYAIVVLILVVIAGVGFLPGIAVGLVLTVVLFVVSYSRIDAVRHSLSGANQRSRVRRDPRDVATLRAEGDATLVLHLQGYLFFGTANALVSRVERRLAASPALRCLIIDFRRVPGVDATAAASFVELARLTGRNACQLLLSDLAPGVARSLDASLGPLASELKFLVLPNLDAALELREEGTLESARRATAGDALPVPAGEDGAPASEGATVPSEPPLQAFSGGGFDATPLLPYLERVKLPRGRRLVEQGSEPDAVYLVVSGQLSARMQGEGDAATRLEAMRAGSLVGEIGFYRGGTRTASVVADTDSVVYRLTHASLERITEERPGLAAAFHARIVTLLAERTVHLMSLVEELER